MAFQGVKVLEMSQDSMSPLPSSMRSGLCALRPPLRWVWYPGKRERRPAIDQIVELVWFGPLQREAEGAVWRPGLVVCHVMMAVCCLAQPASHPNGRDLTCGEVSYQIRCPR